VSRRGNCHDNAVAESFFQLLKRERIRRKPYGTREEAKQDVFDYIEMFYNPKRRHSFSNDIAGRARKAVFSTAVECLENSWRVKTSIRRK
jgi:putative transposase